jgi:hypothetical protein
LQHFGVRPMDPSSIPFDARLLWQGPFETLPVAQFSDFLGWSLWLLPLVFWAAIRARRQLSGFDAFLLLFFLGALPCAWLIGRTMILVGALLPMLIIFLARGKRVAWMPVAVGALLLAQGLSFVRFLNDYRISWYSPPERQAEIAELVDWIDQNLDPGEPVVGDFMNSTAILAHSGNPIVLQPKYETERSRQRARLFMQAFFRGSPASMAGLVGQRWQSKLLLVDRYTLGALSPWVAGSPAGPDPGSVGALLLSQDPGVLSAIPGYELIYRSQLPSDYFRLYRLR